MWFFDFFSYFFSFFLVGLGLLGMYLFKNTKPDFSHVRQDFLCLKKHLMRFLGRSQNESGSVFVAIFGAIAMVAILGTSVMTFMKGPLSTSVRLTKMNTAENQMSIGAQVAVMATASQANNGDCETAPDGYVEPIEWRAPGVAPAPTGGGLVPLSLGISKKDPWGTEYGYCVWNHGPTTSGAGCGTNMLAGTNSKAYPVVSLVSAGPDKAFTTTCISFTAADVNADGDLLDATDLPLISKAAEADDDIITSFTYDEATGVSGGLWSIKSGDASTAVIGKNIETTGTASLKGGLLLPDKSFITCDATTAGVMAMNGSAIEICNGTTWDAITGGSAVGGGLVLTPVAQSAMNVNGTCGTATCYSANQTFTVTNKLSPAAASATLVIALTNTTNFEFVSNGCNGVSLAANATCQMVVRAKTTGNVSFTGTLTVTGNDSPFATLNGIGSNFPSCNVGGAAPGGLYAGCGIGGFDLVITPSGCTSGSTNPTCAGGSDTITLSASTNGKPPSCCGAADGAQSTANLMAYQDSFSTFPAASHCGNLVYGGFDDWFLPSLSQLSSNFYPNRVALGFTNGNYWSTAEYNGDSSLWDFWNFSANTNSSGTSAANQGNSHLVRCMRWTPNKTIIPMADITPDALSFTGSSTSTAGATLTSNTVTVRRVTSPITVSISGGTGAQFSKNGGGYTSTATTATNGDTITLRATAPAAGTEQTVTLTLGSISPTWRVRTLANTNIRVFTTRDTVSSGNLGGVGGGSSICTMRANIAGLGGNWVAVLTSASSDLEPVLPWNWVQMRNTNNQLVATSLGDFLDGSVSAPMSYDEYGNTAAGSLVWTGLWGIGNTGGRVTGDPSPSWTCSGFTTNSSGQSGNYGDSSALSAGNYFRVSNSATAGCDANNLRLLCIETVGTAGLDGDPDAVNVAPAVAYASGGVATSNTVTVTGIVGSVMVTITPSAGTANIIKNGASVGSNTTNVNNNDTIAFSLTAPNTAGQKNTATLTFGPDSYSWWAGYADNANIGMMFVTSTYYQGGLGGLAGADTKCQTLASAAGLSGTWTAILSSSTTDAIDRIPFNYGTIYKVNKATVANNWAQLWAGSLNSTVNLNENGVTMFVDTRSSSLANGRKKPYHCSNWTTSSSYDYYYLGNSTVTDTRWIENQPTNAFPCSDSRPIMCIASLTPAQNNTPVAINIKTKVVYVAGQRTGSSAFVISGIGSPVAISITGGSGNPKFKINGGPDESSSTVANGESVEFFMDAPIAEGTTNSASIQIGTLSYAWKVSYANSANTGKIFVTSVAYQGSLGGLVGADNKCNQLATAAGLSGTWTALLSTSTVDAQDRAPFNWGKLRRMDNVVVANDWDEFVSGNLAAAPNRDENGVLRNTDVMSSTFSTLKRKTPYHCSSWTSSSSYDYYYLGNSSVSDTRWIENQPTNAFPCSDSRPIFCMSTGP